MKKFLITSLSMAFLLPAFASADSYCVSFPTGGESKWSRRDNTIQARFKYNYVVKEEVPRGTTFGFGKGKAVKQWDAYGQNYSTYQYGARDLCIHNPLSVVKENSEINFKDVQLDVKWGGDCPKVAIDGGRFTGTHKFEIYRRKGDHVNPFGCRKK